MSTVVHMTRIIVKRTMSFCCI